MSIRMAEEIGNVRSNLEFFKQVRGLTRCSLKDGTSVAFMKQSGM